MAPRYLEIGGKIYVGIGDGDWLGTFHHFLNQGYKKCWTTRDGRGRYWLVMETE